MNWNEYEELYETQNEKSARILSKRMQYEGIGAEVTALSIWFYRKPSQMFSI